MKKRSGQKGRSSSKGSPGFQPKPAEGAKLRRAAERWTAAAERRTGQIHGQEADGQGARRAARDPKDGGRPKRKARRG